MKKTKTICLDIQHVKNPKVDGYSLQASSLSQCASPFWELKIEKIRQTEAIPAVSIEAHGCFLTLYYDQTVLKGALYPATIRANEELQFPVIGIEHFIYIDSGEALWVDREGGDNKTLLRGELLQISRKNLKQEYLNLKLKGINQATKLVWGVLKPAANSKLKSD